MLYVYKSIKRHLLRPVSRPHDLPLSNLNQCSESRIAEETPQYVLPTFDTSNRQPSFSFCENLLQSYKSSGVLTSTRQSRPEHQSIKISGDSDFSPQKSGRYYLLASLTFLKYIYIISLHVFGKQKSQLWMAVNSVARSRNNRLRFRNAEPPSSPDRSTGLRTPVTTRTKLDWNTQGTRGSYSHILVLSPTHFSIRYTSILPATTCL